ncbi:MAG: FKBP-type peptidyl-prolyl cis-trans isomerase [Planctomycetota bacterium]
MTRLWGWTAAVLLCGSAAALAAEEEVPAPQESATPAAQEPAPTAPIVADKDVSYCLGFSAAMGAKIQGIQVEVDPFLEGARAALSDEEPKIPRNEFGMRMMDLRQKLMARERQETARLDETNRLEGAAFLEENKKKEGVVALPSGLQYKALAPGAGRKPGAQDLAVVHYRGRLLNGEEFDSSYTRGQPARFRVNQIIPGWAEALQLMQEGAKWEVYIPSELAYGDRGAGDHIPPGATLIFEIELLSIESPTPEGNP